MKVRYLTVKQLRQTASKYKYIAVRYDDGVIGINCKIQNTKKAKSASDETVTNAISYYPISFMEYISLKTPFF